MTRRRPAALSTGHHPRGGAASAPDTAAPGLRTGSLRVRTVVAVLLLLAVLLAALAVTVELTLGQRLRAQVVDRLSDRAAAAAALVGTVDGDELADRLSAQGLSVVIRDANGDAIVAGPSPDQLRDGPPSLGEGGPGRGGPASGLDDGRGGAGTDTQDGTGTGATGTGATGTDSGDAGSASSSDATTVTSSEVRSDDEVTTLVSQLSDGSTITLTTDSRSVGETLVQLRWVMIGASAAFLLIAAIGLALVVRATLRPLDRMTTVARSIAHGDRGRRLRPARRDTEIGRVAVAFDEMLDGVEGAERTALDAETRVRAFVSDAAHELRTPVAGMRAAADTLVRSPGTADERERLATHVVREAERASRLIDDMLLMARVDQGISLDVAPVDLGASLLADVERHRLRRPSLDLRVVLPDGPVVVAADAERVSQIVGNLVDNAARATAGTGQVTLWLDASRADEVAVFVSDDGPGVPDVDRERVFDRLVRLDEARRSGDGGAGLGLPIARGLARAHGGDLVCEASGSGRPGAVFRLTLPLGVGQAGSEPAAAAGAPTAAPAPALRRTAD
ncbi:MULTISPECIES: HAMP domain-containing sensor histidine kinase [unclassified Frigoribacterium]|uniref:sensor histidine kinase n=1 Tax=unclassified Frigoribacterium TaxID=2627005 RepID=UPI0009EC3A56|nr:MULTISPECIES: HAMP domain-containing sensor histidine kinase [unclassified Frigoribacterium]